MSVKQNPLMDKRSLRSLRKDVFWDPSNDLVSTLRNKDDIEINDLDSEQLWHLIKELDRRFIQLWDKVSFERKEDLVDYSPFTSRPS